MKIRVIDTLMTEMRTVQQRLREEQAARLADIQRSEAARQAAEAAQEALLLAEFNAVCNGNCR
jgi:hypothetical protein